MFNYKLTLEYNGAGFSGSQIQNEHRTVQEELEKALAVYFRKPVASCFSSRTDAGVHAIGQVANFKVEEAIEVDQSKFLLSLNGILPEDIAVTKLELVAEDFNARFAAQSREYLYKIFNRRARPVLRLDSLYWVKEPLDFAVMQAHAAKFIGTHDFIKYTKAEDDGKPNYLCTVYESELIQESKICFKYKIKANRFLRHMVRKIVAEIIAVGRGENPETVSETAMAPADGLTLMSVNY